MQTGHVTGHAFTGYRPHRHGRDPRHGRHRLHNGERRTAGIYKGYSAPRLRTLSVLPREHGAASRARCMPFYTLSLTSIYFYQTILCPTRYYGSVGGVCLACPTAGAQSNNPTDAEQIQCVPSRSSSRRLLSNMQIPPVTTFSIRSSEVIHRPPPTAAYADTTTDIATRRTSRTRRSTPQCATSTR